MKKLLSVLLSMLCMGTNAMAQSALVATLNHEGSVSAYYGGSAFIEAFDAATDGDVINLSSGSFQSCDITKAVTIRGAGMEYDSLYLTAPTVLTGDFTLNVGESSKNLMMEGIAHKNTVKMTGTLRGATFLKCCFNNFDHDNLLSFTGISFIHCRITGDIDPNQGEISIDFRNSVVREACFGGDPKRSANFYNCIVVNNVYRGSGYGSWNSFRDVNNFVYTNCILINGSGYSNSINGSNTLINCVANSGNCTNSQNNGTNKIAGTNIFVSWNEQFASSSYELTSEAQNEYKGTDGTQVGLYGGSYPFCPTTSVPHITKLEVASKSSEDGKLSVTIEVKGAQ